MKTAVAIGLALAAATSGIARADTSPVAVAQAEIRIPSDAELDRMERKAIATPPLDVSGAPVLKGSERSQDLQMDRQDVIVDQEVMRGICADCK
jgi:hypothetical protein